jgi:ethanolamine utilization protein EutQ (cupin superfamily)
MPLKRAANAQRIELPSMGVPARQAFLAGVHTSNDTAKPITRGFFRMEKGPALVYDYGYEEMKVIVEGEMTISDETGQSGEARPGDVFYFAKGSRITFSSPTYGIGFFCGQSSSARLKAVRNWC